MRYIAAWFFSTFLCAGSASENHTFSNMPGCITSANQTSMCPLLWGQSHTVPLHCIMGKLRRVVAGVGVGWMSHLVVWWCKSMCTHVGRDAIVTRMWGCSAFVITESLNENPQRGGQLCFCHSYSMNKSSRLQSHQKKNSSWINMGTSKQLVTE